MERKSICIATPDIIGPIRNGGIGTACFEIAKVWRVAGHDVTILYVNNDSGAKRASDPWRKLYKALGIKFVFCPKDNRSGVPEHLALPWDAWQWLQKQSFDIVYFPEWRAVGLYTVLAKRSGLGFRTTRLIVGLHSPTSWHSFGGMMFPQGIWEVALDAAERQCVALADTVVSPSQYMVDYISGEDWALPDDVRVIPNPFSAPTQQPASSDGARIEEIVFFGRLERRKGLMLFMKALAQIPERDARRLKVTFLGKPGYFPGDVLGYLIDGASDRFQQWRVIDDLDSHGALKYLTEPGRLAVIPSLAENSPMTVRECIALGIPFLASNVGGIPELISSDVKERVLFEPTPIALAKAIKRVIEERAVRVRSPFTEESVDKAWHETVETADAAAAAADGGDAKVSVIIPTYNRPRELEEALKGLRAQTWKNFEVVLVDDGGSDPQAIAKIECLQPEFDAAGWKIIRQKNSYLGAARNAGWRQARGDLIIFHDDDNISSPTLIETYVRALATSGADIATCTMAPFNGPSPVGSSRDSRRVYPFIGNAAGIGLFTNQFGDAHACFRRSALEALGGFTEDYGIGHEDWEIFARASLRGLKIITVPEPLFWYRESEQSMLRSRLSGDPDHVRSLRPYLESVPAALRPALQFALSQFLKKEDALAHRKTEEALPAQAEEAPARRKTEIEALCLSVLPGRLRSTQTLLRACKGELHWLDPVWNFRFSIGEVNVLRRLNRIGAKYGENIDFNTMLLGALPPKIKSIDQVLELASLSKPWQEIAWRHPLKIAYWQAARRVQRAARRMRRGGYAHL